MQNSRFLCRPRLCVESLEIRSLLAAFPAYVDGVFTFGDPTPNIAPYGLTNTFLLSSLPTATKTIYLDFDGFHSVSNSWNHNIVFPSFDTNGDPSTFTNAELIEIQKSFQNVAEDFLPFNINVTTKEPPPDYLIKVNSADQYYGVRSVQTQATNGFGNGIGGVAMLNSFDDNRDNPVFAFNKGSTNGGMTISHEVGHALGLNHDGLNSSTYHPGVGSGPTGWGPLMGAPFGMNLTQWSKGDYTGATNTEDDLVIITKAANGFTYRADDHGSDRTTASILTPSAGMATDWGIIERNTDLDFFGFTTAASSSVTINITPFGEDPDLDVLLTVTDSSGNVVGTANASTALMAQFSFPAGGGTYYFSVDGVGLPGRYSDYGSLGFYMVTVTGITEDSLVGDFNDNGSLEIGDLDLLMEDIYQATLGGGDPATFDVTSDGLVNLADRDWWLGEAGAANLPSGLPYLLGDVDLDGSVDEVDFSAWAANQFTNQTAWSAGNFTDDNAVDGVDFGFWHTNRGQSSLRRAVGGHPFMTVTDQYPDDLVLNGEGPVWPLGHDGNDDGHDHVSDVFVTALPTRQFIVDPWMRSSDRHVAVRSAQTDFGGMKDEQSAFGRHLRNVREGMQQRKQSGSSASISASQRQTEAAPHHARQLATVDLAFAMF